MTVTGLDHVGFTVADLDRSVAWYSRLLQAPPTLRETWEHEYIGRIAGYPGCRMDGALWTLPGGIVLELLCYAEPPTGRVDMETYNAGNGHLCLVVDDLDAELERLRGDVAPRSPGPVEIPWGPYKGCLTVYVRDPDGISIQLFQLPPGGLTPL